MRRHSIVWVSITLWVASNLFVSCFARVATWENNASYVSMADLCRWDCAWYSSVLQRGYDKSSHEATGWVNWPFHPLFPLTAYPLWRGLNLSAPGSLVLAGKLALFLAIYGFILMSSAEAESTPEHFKAGSLVAFNPYVIYAHAGYAEPLYFGLLALAFYFADRRRWIASGTMGALVSSSRVIGFLFPISYVLIVLEDLKWRPTLRRIGLEKIVGLLLCPLGTAVFMLYLYRHTGDALAQVHAHIAWGKSPGNPFHVLWDSLTTHHWPRVWGIMTIVGLIGSIYLFMARKAGLGAFLAISLLLSVSGGYFAIARYIWWQPPFLYAIYRVLRDRISAWLIYTAFASAMASFMIIEWFSGHNFVV